MSEHDGSNGAVAVVDGGAVAIGGGFDAARVNLIRRTFGGGAPPLEFELFVEVCRRTGLSPEAKQIYFIKRGGRWTTQTSIDGFRLIADRSGRYAGSDEPVFTGEGRLPNGRAHPEKASVTVWKIVGGQRCPFTGVALWDEYNAGQGLWLTMPHTMLAKVSESQALRKAFPAELSGLLTRDEMAQADPEPAVPHGAAPEVVDVVAHEVPGPGPRDPEARRFAREIAEADTPAALKAVAGRLHEWGGADDALRDAYRARMAALVPPTARDDGDAEGGPRPGGITKPQMGKLWAIARQKLGDAADETLHAMASETHGLGLDPTLWDLTKADASEVIEYLSDTDEQTLRADLGPVVFDWRERQRRAGENPPLGEPPPVATEDAGHEAAFAAVMDGMPGAEEPARDWGA